MSTSYNNLHETRTEEKIEMMQNSKYNKPAEMSQNQMNMNAPRVLPSIPAVQFGPESQRCICHSCHADISTTVRPRTSMKTHCMAMLMCMSCCFLCSWLPYCMNTCRNQNHYCPSCGSYLGKYE